MGNKVWVKACLREGREAVLKYKPDVVVVPPIRNPYSRDFVRTCKSWGCAVVSRHTEASCDWQDYNAMDPRGKIQIMGPFQYYIEAELVWGADEAEILNKRPATFKAIPVGALATDIYLQPSQVREKVAPVVEREKFNKRYGFSNDKKTLLIACPWGFADSAPDLHIDDIGEVSKEEKAKQAHIEMIRAAAAVLDDWNVLVTLHPGVRPEVYKDVGVPVDTESTAYDLITNADALIHGGSTLGITAHFCDIPAFQYQNQNCLTKFGWFDLNDVPMAKLSPRIESIGGLIKAVQGAERKTNADFEVLRNLATGRYGIMDGNAALRSAHIINNMKGKFQMCWPESKENYTVPGIMYRTREECLRPRACGICKHQFFSVLENEAKPGPRHCPWCGARMVVQ